MKKTLTVNLGGTVYHIDEDAYQLLDNYLINLRFHFQREEGADEIIKDIELRISELFSERVNAGYQVISIEYVEEVIARLGKPEELSEEDTESNLKKNSEENLKEKYRKDRQENGGENFDGNNKKSYAGGDSENNKENNADHNKGNKRENSEENQSTANGRFSAKNQEQIRHRLYRDPDDKILGGVASGLAAYMGWDPTLVRIILLLLLFIPYLPIVWIYLACWIIIPEAHTAAQKLAMRGENVTIENIGKTVTDGFEKASNGMNNYINSDKPRSTLQKAGDLLVQVVGVILKISLIIIAIFLSPVLFVLAILFIALIFAAFGVMSAGVGTMFYHLMPNVNWAAVNSFPMAMYGISGVLLAGIPLGALVYILLQNIFHWKPMSSGWKWTLLILWLLALVGSIFFFSQHNIPVTDWRFNNLF